MILDSFKHDIKVKYYISILKQVLTKCLSMIYHKNRIYSTGNIDLLKSN